MLPGMAASSARSECRIDISTRQSSETLIARGGEEYVASNPGNSTLGLGDASKGRPRTSHPGRECGEGHRPLRRYLLEAACWAADLPRGFISRRRSSPVNQGNPVMREKPPPMEIS